MLRFQVETALDFAPRYDIAPTWAPGHEPLIVLLNSSGQRELAAARWWMIPENWRLRLAKLPTAFNARSEELGNKRFWTRSFNARRCLVPATGWREFTGGSGTISITAMGCSRSRALGTTGIRPRVSA